MDTEWKLMGKTRFRHGHDIAQQRDRHRVLHAGFHLRLGFTGRLDADRDRTQHCRELARTARSARSEEHTSELQSLMRISYAVFCLKKKNVHMQKIQETNKHQV